MTPQNSARSAARRWHSACSGHGYNEPMPGSDAMKPLNPGVKLTYDDFVLFPDDGKRHELIDGEHYVSPSPNRKHQKICGNLHLLIGTWLEEHPIGQIYFAPFDVIFSMFDVVEADLLYLTSEPPASSPMPTSRERRSWSSK